MGVPAGWKDFTSSILSTEDVNNYLMSQSVMVFDNAASRTAELGTPAEGMLTYLRDTSALETYNGTTYVDVGGGAGLFVLKSGDTMTGSLTITGGLSASLSTNGNIALTGNSTRITQNSTATWSGDAGAGFGKLEYHSNRWYINAGNDSAQIVEFRRGGSTTGHVANDGRFNIPFWTTSGRNNSNEWIQFNNYSGLYSPLNAAHFYPNDATFGAWRIAGSRNTWQGLEFDTSDGQKSLMMGASGAPTYSGIHHTSKGWRWFVIERVGYFEGLLPIDGNNTGYVGGVPAFGVPAHNFHSAYQFFNPSDGRFKDNQRALPLGLSFLKRLTPMEYTNIYPIWEDVDSHDPNNLEKQLRWENGTRLRSGLIAQEVKQALIDEGVGDYAMWGLADKDDPDSFQALSYHEFVAPLINAVQEIAERLEVLEARL